MTPSSRRSRMTASSTSSFGSGDGDDPAPQLAVRTDLPRPLGCQAARLVFGEGGPTNLVGCEKAGSSGSTTV